MSLYHLAGDIGGTKTSLAVVDKARGPALFLEKANFLSAEFPSVALIVEKFLEGKDWNLASASFGIAGPVINGGVQATNLPWFVEEKALGEQLNMPVRIINDLSATALAVPFLRESDLFTLNPGLPVENGTIAVIAPGTGLGEAYLHWNGAKFRAFPSEGGHADFAPVNPLQIKLLAFLLKRSSHVSYEYVGSGRGLPNIYSFLKEEAIYEEPGWLKGQINEAADPTPLITKAAVEGTAEIAVAALDLFSAILGAEAGNLALKVLPGAGVYFGGGIPPRIIPFLEKEHFLMSFRNKGRFASYLKDIPVHVIQNPETALIGAACHVLEVGEN